jgi:hypothetical protein
LPTSTKTKATAIITAARTRNISPILDMKIDETTAGLSSYYVKYLRSVDAKLRNLITKRGIPLCCTTNPVRHKQFRNALKGFSTRTLSIRLKELERGGILEKHRYNEIPPRVEYTLTTKGQELVESIVSLLQWMRKWSNSKKR